MNAPKHRNFAPGLEILEGRIAPAALLVGVIGNASDAEFSDAPFVNMFTSVDSISNAVGHAAGTYYVKIGIGEAFSSIATGPSGDPFLNVTSGKVIAFFQDLNNDNEVQRNELISLSLGPHVRLDLDGDLAGDVVSNFVVANNPANETIDMSHAIAGQGIQNFSAGILAGKILTGGSISKASLTSAVGVLAGSATDGQAFDFFPGIASGAGTLAFVPAAGKAGGSISNLTVENIGEVRAGAGGAGAAGGSLTNIVISAAIGGVTLIAGDGGDAPSGAGGKGGSASFIHVAGGVPPLGGGGSLTLVTGDGGDGTFAGAGGALLESTFVTNNLTQSITTGDGGKNLGGGDGGAGGRISKLQIDAGGTYLNAAVDTPVFANVTSGTGGKGGTVMGNISSGGAGGTITSTSVTADGAAALVGGNGGNGGGGAAGRGASILYSEVLAGGGDVPLDAVPDSAGSLQAGHAGTTGAKPGAGGSIIGLSEFNPSVLIANTDISVIAGDGSGGGDGGAIKFVSYGATDPLLVPSGEIIVKAGHGSVDAAGKFAGAGGSISSLVGTVTSGVDLPTTIQAGDGGGNGLRSSRGGSISQVSLIAGPGPAVLKAGVLTVAAGDAGNAGLAAGAVTYATGATGGSVSHLEVNGIGQNTIFRSVAAGAGAPGSANGGAGGRVLDVQVADHDIGVKSGETYGYATMGGIFAGAGGAGGTNDGLAGKVQFVGADSISAIVAGKGAAPSLAEQVDHITLSPGPDLVPSLGTQFALNFHPIVQVVESVAGNGATQEQQTITRLLGGSNASLQPPGGFTTFQLTFNGQTTDPIDANADVADIEAALDALSTIPAGVTVTDNAPNPNAVDKGGQTFTVTFNGNGARNPITGLGEEKTSLLAGNALPAEVQDALNKLPNIDDGVAANAQFDGVDVVAGVDAGFQITFRNGGDQGVITGERIFAVHTTPAGPDFSQDQNVDVLGVGSFQLSVDVGFGPETTHLIPAAATPAQVAAAINSLNGVMAVGEHVDVKAGINSSYDIHFQFAESSITGQEFSHLLATTSVQGTPVVHEVQTIDSRSLRPANPNGLVFVVPNAGSVAVAGDASATDVQAALNTLLDDGNGGNGIKNGVTVSVATDNTYSIHFNTPADQVAITAFQQLPVVVSAVDGTAGTAESQRVDVNNLGSFTFAFAANPNATTALLQPNASAQQVQDKINALAGANVVTVTGGIQGVYDITFTSNGDQPTLIVSETVPLFTPPPPIGLPANTIQLTVPREITFIPTEYAAAHLVGAIADFNELGSDRFKFIDADNDGVYDFNNGEIPIDGLVAARKLAPINVIPQAQYNLAFQLKGKFVPVPAGTEFFDFHNQ